MTPDERTLWLTTFAAEFAYRNRVESWGPSELATHCETVAMQAVATFKILRMRIQHIFEVSR